MLDDGPACLGWDVVTDFYVVRAEKAGCTSPDGTQPFVETSHISR